LLSPVENSYTALWQKGQHAYLSLLKGIYCVRAIIYRTGKVKVKEIIGGAADFFERREENLCLFFLYLRLARHILPFAFCGKAIKENRMRYV